jgi:hypothetical protein
MSATCRDVREASPDLVLGALSGSERADMLAHIATCLECRRYVDDMAQVADALLVLAPEAEPPAGFESRVLARVQPRRRRTTVRWIAAVAAAALLATVGTWVGASHAFRLDRATQSSFRALGGHELIAKDLRNVSDQTHAGYAVAYDGADPWVFVFVQNQNDAQTYTIECEYKNGTTQRWPNSMRLRGGSGAWGGMIGKPVDQLRDIRIVDADGSPEYVATF